MAKIYGVSVTELTILPLLVLRKLKSVLKLKSARNQEFSEHFAMIAKI
jgi:hypothetical protein